MYYYHVTVPTTGEALTTRETIITRLEYFNSRTRYMMFDKGDNNEWRFIMVSKKRITKNQTSDVEEIFEAPVSLKTINVKCIDRSSMKKIKMIKHLMTSNEYYGDYKMIIVTESEQQIVEKAESFLGCTAFKSYLKNLPEYIERTAHAKAKSLYNTVLINKSDACVEEYIEMIYSMFATKGVLDEHILAIGDIDDARRADSNRTRQSRHVFHIEDSWTIHDNDEYFRASDEVKFLTKIHKNDTIYITSMTESEYEKLSMLEIFMAAFPNTVVIDALTEDEKIESICKIAAEYDFSVKKEDFIGSRFIKYVEAGKLESTVRHAVLSKLTAKCETFELTLADIDMKVRRAKKISAFAELENLIGLDAVKATVREIVLFLKKRGKKAVPCLHMAFLGNPGTGKTTVARIIARIFAETGITKKDLLVETDRGGLIGLYVGHTADKTRRKIDSAMGGVLFIDEAYSLFSESGIDYGHECVSTLVKEMEDRRTDFVCILAGYTEEMGKMLGMNPGLRDRIQFYIDFPNYNEDELLKIFENFCKAEKYKLSGDAKKALTKGFSDILRTNSKNFSNGRIVRKIFERARMKQALRASNNLITDADIHTVFAEKDIMELFGKNKRRAIGFAA